MKHLKRRLAALALAGAMLLGLGTFSLAAGTSFADVPESHWAYADVEAAASAGLMNGTGNGAFSPDIKVSAAQFLTLVGRVVFPDVKAEGADWYGPYVSVAQNMGLLDGTLVNVDDLGAEITRYDMAAILRSAAKVMGVNDKMATQSDVADYMDIPNRYTQAVLAVYGMGLIRGDQAGRFNGANAMTRAEVAVVVNRLAQKKVQGASYKITFPMLSPPQGVFVVGESATFRGSPDPWSEARYNIYYGADGFSCTSSNPDVVEVVSDGATEHAWWTMTAKGAGTATVIFIDPYGVSASREITVVERRENMGTMTRTVRVWAPTYYTHTLSGAGLTDFTKLSAVPFEIRHTRDGGETFQVVYEGVTPTLEPGNRRDTTSYSEFEVEIPEDAFYGLDSGLYVSIDAVVEGQRWVTPDRRTDGRGEISRFKGHDRDQQAWFSPTLTPPEGEELPFVFDGHLQVHDLNAKTYADAANFAVQLRLLDGTILAETVTDAEGMFSVDCAIDVLDLPTTHFTSTRIFDVTYTGDLDGDHYEYQWVRPNYSFEMLHIWDYNGPDHSLWEHSILK